MTMHGPLNIRLKIYNTITIVVRKVCAMCVPKHKLMSRNFLFWASFFKFVFY